MTIRGTKDRPRLFVFRSNQHIYAQLIDDSAAKVLMSICDMDLKQKQSSGKVKRVDENPAKKTVGNKEHSDGARKSDIAKQVGMLIAKKAIESKIEKVIFDRGGFIFQGRVKALADGAREGGLQL